MSTAVAIPARRTRLRDQLTAPPVSELPKLDNPEERVVKDIRLGRREGRSFTCFSAETMSESIRARLTASGYRLVRYSPDLWLVEWT